MLLPQIGDIVADMRSDEYSEVTYSTQRAMAGDKSKHVVGLSRVCVEGIIKHNYA